MSLRARIFRWILSIGLLGCALALAKHGYDTLEFAWFIPALALAFIGVGLVLRDLIALGTAPLVGLIEALIFPRVLGGKPKTNYKLAEFYVAEDRIEEAEDEFRTIIRHHPREKDAYLRLLDLLMVQEKPAEAEKIFQRGKRVFRRDPDNLSLLEVRWKHLRDKYGWRG